MIYINIKLSTYVFHSNDHLIFLKEIWEGILSRAFWKNIQQEQKQEIDSKKKLSLKKKIFLTSPHSHPLLHNSFARDISYNKKFLLNKVKTDHAN